MADGQRMILIGLLQIFGGNELVSRDLPHNLDHFGVGDAPGDDPALHHPFPLAGVGIEGWRGVGRRGKGLGSPRLVGLLAATRQSHPDEEHSDRPSRSLKRSYPPHLFRWNAR